MCVGPTAPALDYIATPRPQPTPALVPCIVDVDALGPAAWFPPKGVSICTRMVPTSKIGLSTQTDGRATVAERGNDWDPSTEIRIFNEPVYRVRSDLISPALPMTWVVLPSMVPCELLDVGSRWNTRVMGRDLLPGSVMVCVVPVSGLVGGCNKTKGPVMVNVKASEHATGLATDMVRTQLG